MCTALSLLIYGWKDKKLCTLEVIILVSQSLGVVVFVHVFSRSSIEMDAVQTKVQDAISKMINKLDVQYLRRMQVSKYDLTTQSVRLLYERRRHLV